MIRLFSLWQAFSLLACFVVSSVLIGCSCSDTISKEKEISVTQQANNISIPEGVALLTWNNFDGLQLSDPQAATYILNGQEMGKGESGFTKVLAAVAKLPRKTDLWVYPDDFVNCAHESSTGSEPAEYIKTVPFRRSDVLVQKLKQVTMKNDISVYYLAAAPGEVTWDGKEDLMLSESSRDKVLKFTKFWQDN